MSRKNLFWFLFVVLTVVLISGCETSRLSGEAESRGDDAVADMIYFVPEEADLIEAELSPDILSRNEFLAENDLSLLATSDWEAAADQLANDHVQALLIHHAALASVNQAELQMFFDENSLVVAGIGIPGLELAQFLGHSGLFTSTWPADEGYTTPYYFYVYSLEISNNGLSSGSSTDSLLGNGRITPMFRLIAAHGQN